MDAPILDIANLTRTVAQDGQKLTVVNDVSYNFFENKIYTIIGPSGAGKSSLLRLINRLDEPTSGKVLFHGKEHCDYQPCELRQKSRLSVSDTAPFRGHRSRQSTLCQQ